MRLVLALLVLALPSAAAPVWTAYGPEGGALASIALDADGHTLYARGVHVYRSADGGVTWRRPATLGEPQHTTGVSDVVAAPGTPGTLYADGRGLWKSTDGGASWRQLPLSASTVVAVAVDAGSPSTVYAGDVGHVWRSNDGGATWTRSDIPGARSISALLVTPGHVLAGTAGAGAFVSSDGGATWQAAAGLSPAKTVTSFAVDPRDPRTVYAGALDGEIYRSGDGGASWQLVHTFAAPSPDYRNDTDGLLVLPDGRVLATTNGTGVWLSDDLGATWQQSNLRFHSAYALVREPSGRIWTASSDGLWSSDDRGATWTRHAHGIVETDVRALMSDGRVGSPLYAGSWGQGVVVSYDRGRSWTTWNQGDAPDAVNGIAFDGPLMYAITDGYGFYRYVGGWTPSNTGLGTDVDLQLTSIAVEQSGRVWVSSRMGSVYRSDDHGRTWRDGGLGHGGGIFGPTPLALLGSRLYVGSFGVSLHTATGWVSRSRGLPAIAQVDALAGNGPTLYAAVSQAGVYRSRDGGLHWRFTGLRAETVPALVDHGGIVDVGLEDGRVLETHDGVHWRQRGATLPSPVASLAWDGVTLYAATKRGVFALRSPA